MPNYTCAIFLSLVLISGSWNLFSSRWSCSVSQTCLVSLDLAKPSTLTRQSRDLFTMVCFPTLQPPQIYCLPPRAPRLYCFPLLHHRGGQILFVKQWNCGGPSPSHSFTSKVCPCNFSIPPIYPFSTCSLPFLYPSVSFLYQPSVPSLCVPFLYH